MYDRQANVLVPSIFIAHDPQMPSRQDRRKVSEGSCSFLILKSASRTMGPQLREGEREGEREGDGREGEREGERGEM